MPKYQIFDMQGNEAGHIILKTEQNNELQSIQPTAIANDAIANAALLATSLVGFSSVGYLATGYGWLGATLGLCITAGLAGIKAWRIPQETTDEKPQKELVIRAEFRTENGLILDDFSRWVDPGQLMELCRLIQDKQRWIGRDTANDIAGIKRKQHGRIRRDFVKLQYLDTVPTDELTRKGWFFVNAICDKTNSY